MGRTTTSYSGMVLIAATIICTASFAAAQPLQDKLADLERTMVAEIAQTKTPGAAILLVQGDKVIYARWFGATSVEGGSAVTPDTLFRIGSTTKMFTAAAFATLAAHNKVRPDSPVSTYLDGLPSKIGKLSAHQLMSQSSGLRDFNTEVISDDDGALALNVALWKDDAFFTEPDTIYSYSSANFWLTGLIVEKVNGKPYADSMAELLFQPLGMKRTFLRPREAMTYPLALGHNRLPTGHEVNRPVANNAAIYPGGSIYSSVNDLSRWLIAMLNNGSIDGKQALPRTVVESLLKPQFALPGAEPAFYSYGMLGYNIDGVKTIGHGGVSRGYGATIFFAPEQKFGLVVLTNSNGQTLPRTRTKANELFLPLKPSPVAGTSTAIPNDLSRYAGKYSHSPQSWEFFVRDAKLFLRSNGKEFELKPSGKDEFAYEQGGFLFVPNGKGEYEHIFMGLYAARRG